jgi:hypothetical protein
MITGATPGRAATTSSTAAAYADRGSSSEKSEYGSQAYGFTTGVLLEWFQVMLSVRDQNIVGHVRNGYRKLWNPPIVDL